jgi:hypothetical protein
MDIFVAALLCYSVQRTLAVLTDETIEQTRVQRKWNERVMGFLFCIFRHGAEDPVVGGSKVEITACDIPDSFVSIVGKHTHLFLKTVH